MKKDILIHIKSAFDAAGINATKEQLNTIAPKLDEMNRKAQAVGGEFKKSFNPIETISAAMSGNFRNVGIQLVALAAQVKGVALSMAAWTGIGSIIAAVAFGISKLVSHFKEAKTEAEAAAKATAENFAKRTQEATKALNEEYQAQLKSIEDVCKAKNAELDATQALIEAEIRLQKTKAGASKEAIESAVAESRARTNAAKAANEIAMGANVADVRKNYVDNMKTELAAMGDRLASYERQATDKMAEQREKFRTESHIEVMGKRGSEDLAPSFIEEAVRRKTDKKMKKWMADNKDALFDTEINGLVESINLGYKNLKGVEADIAKAEADKARRDKLHLAASKNEEAKAIQESTNARIKAEEQVHAKRMELLRQTLSSRQTAAAGYLADFQAGGSGIAAERKRAEDEERMRKVADSFKWAGTTNQLTAALNAGDTEEYSRILSWNRDRRGSAFTPEVEAAVRGIAETRAGDATQNELKKIGTDVKGLRDDIKELLSMK